MFALFVDEQCAFLMDSAREIPKEGPIGEDGRAGIDEHAVRIDIDKLMIAVKWALAMQLIAARCSQSIGSGLVQTQMATRGRAWPEA